MRAGGDIEENHFIRALIVVPDRQLDGIANIAQFALFGIAELNPARDLAAMDIQARNDTLCNHERLLNLKTTPVARTKRRPALPPPLNTPAPTAPRRAAWSEASKL